MVAVAIKKEFSLEVERRAKAAAAAKQHDQWATTKVVLIGFTFFTFASCVAASVKMLIRPTVLPYPLMIVFFNMWSLPIFSSVLCKFMPSLYPRRHMVSEKPWITLRRSVYIAVGLVGSCILNKSAYMYVPLSLVQVMKGTICVTVFIGSVMFGIATFKWRTFFVLLFIVFCLFMNVGEDLHVELHGVVYQFAANVEQSKVKVNDFIILARIRRNNPKVRFSILNNHSNLTVGFRHGQNRVS